jgi:uncharacterized protein YjiS (DUF1127 family)
MNDILASAPALAVEARRRAHGLAALRGLIRSWRSRSRFRRDLADRLEAAPHLVDDIGLTRRQVDAELAKPFWQR